LTSEEPFLFSVYSSKISKKSLETLPVLSLEEAVSLTKTHLGMSSLRLAEGQGSSLATPVRSIAVCAGSGASVIGTLPAYRIRKKLFWIQIRTAPDPK
jgi:hypothetical protein